MTSTPHGPTERLSTQPTARTFRVEALVRLVNDGKIRVPDFQRRFRWGSGDVEALFDSLLRGFPVGNLLLWHKRDNPAQTVRLGALTITAPADDALWVVDGQQRVTSIVNAVSVVSDEQLNLFSLVYDLTTQRVVRRAAGTPGTTVPVPVLFDLRRLLSWIQQHPEFADHVERLNDVATRLRDVEIPASIVDTTDDAVLREIFDRTNNAGKRLSRAEVFTALSGASSGAPDDLSLGRLADAVDDASRFGALDDDTVLRAVLACRGSDVTREIRREFTGRADRSEFPQDDEQRAYARAQAALVDAVAFLQNDVGIPHLAFLPYRYLLVVLTRFFAHFPSPHPRNRELLARWTWEAALRGPEIFKGSSTGAMGTLCTRVRPGAESESVQELVTAVSRPHAPAPPDLEKFRTNDAATRIVLCVLWSCGPRSLDTGEVMTVDSLAAVIGSGATALEVVFDVVPRGRLTSSRAAANRIIAYPGDAESARRLLRGEADLFEADLPRGAILASHAIDDAARAALERRDDAAFIAARTAVLERLVADFTTARAGVGLEATPPLHELDFDDDDDEGPRDDSLELTDIGGSGER